MSFHLLGGLGKLLGGKYLSAVPLAKAPNYHGDLSTTVNGVSANDAGGWSFNNVASDANVGTLWVNCTHTDTRGQVWTTY